MSIDYDKNAFQSALGKPAIARDRDPISHAETKPVGPTVIRGSQLTEMEFEDPRFVLVGLVPHGCTVFSGPEKAGKTLFCMELALAAASGRDAFDAFPMEESEVLYILGEGTLRSFQERAFLIEGQDLIPDLEIWTDCPIGEDAIEAISTWAIKRDNGLVIVDTAQIINPPRAGRATAYERMNKAFRQFTAICEKRGISIWLIHHDTREFREDPFSRVSGGVGVGAAVDTICVVERNARDELVFYVKGREVEKREAVFEFNPKRRRWSYQGEREYQEPSHKRQRIAEFMIANRGVWFAPKVISSEVAAVSYDAVRKALPKMAADPNSVVITDGKGQYSVQSDTHHPSHPAQPSLNEIP